MCIVIRQHTLYTSRLAIHVTVTHNNQKKKKFQISGASDKDFLVIESKRRNYRLENNLKIGMSYFLNKSKIYKSKAEHYCYICVRTTCDKIYTGRTEKLSFFLGWLKKVGHKK